MIDEKYLTKRFISHAINNMNVSDKLVRRLSDKSVCFFGIDYFFEIGGDEIDVKVELVDPQEKKAFNDYLGKVLEPTFWKKGFLIHLKKVRDDYKSYLHNLRAEINGNGNYHFRAELKTKNRDNAFFAVFNNIVRPVNLYNDERARE